MNEQTIVIEDREMSLSIVPFAIAYSCIFQISTDYSSYL